MKKILLRLFLGGIILFGLFLAYEFYGQYREHQRRSVYYDKLKESASPTVTVLKDSILIGYRNEKRTIHIYVPPEYDKDTVSAIQ